MEHFIRNLYKIHITTESPTRLAYFKKCALYTEYLFIGMAALYVSAVCSFLLYPFYMYAFENEIVPIIPIYLPGIDENTRNGFIILSSFHISAYFMVISGVFAYDFLITILTVSPLICAKLIWFEMEQLKCDLEGDESPIVIKYHFRNILLLHQQMGEYMERLDKVTFKTFTGQVMLCSIGAIVGVYVVLTVIC